MPADTHEVHEKTNSHVTLVRYQLEISLIAFYHVLTMFLSLPQCPDLSMLHIFGEGGSFWFDRSRIGLILAILILSFEAEGK